MCRKTVIQMWGFPVRELEPLKLFGEEALKLIDIGVGGCY
jgi:hypothetical protein